MAFPELSQPAYHLGRQARIGRWQPGTCHKCSGQIGEPATLAKTDVLYDVQIVLVLLIEVRPLTSGDREHEDEQTDNYASPREQDHYGSRQPVRGWASQPRA